MNTRALPGDTVLVEVVRDMGGGRRLVKLPDGREVEVEGFDFAIGEIVEVFAWRVGA